jgi:hypothetical protein
MYRKGLFLAGLVGGMVMFGGSALAAMPNNVPTFNPDPDNTIFICGDDSIFAKGDVDNGARGVLVLELNDVLGQVLGSKSEETKCAIS